MATDPTEHYSPVYSWYVVAVLLLAYTVAFIDRSILSLLVEPIKSDLQISDTQIGLLAGFAFAIFYSVLGIPIARLADRSKRTAIISIGVALWSIMTAACGLSKTYWQLFLMRVGVGVGEAALSPAAYSILADYFPPHKLARAISVYAMGLYGGAGLAMLAGSTVVAFVSQTKSVSLPLVGVVMSWQLTFFMVSLPGILVLALMATVKEPIRKQSTLDTNSEFAAKSRQSVAEVAAFLKAHKRIIVAHFGGFMCLGIVISAYMIWVPEFLRRAHEYAIADAGLIYGALLLTFGTAGPYAGAWYTEVLRRRGHHDAEMRAAYHGALWMIPVATLTPLVAHDLVVVMLAILTFVLSFPQGLTPTILQLVAPNRMRAQVTAVFMLIGVLSGYTIGPASVAMLSDYVFKDEGAITISLAIVSAVLLPIGALFLRSGLSAYGAHIKNMNADLTL